MWTHFLSREVSESVWERVGCKSKFYYQSAHNDKIFAYPGVDLPSGKAPLNAAARMKGCGSGGRVCMAGEWLVVNGARRAGRPEHISSSSPPSLQKASHSLPLPSAAFPLPPCRSVPILS